MAESCSMFLWSDYFIRFDSREAQGGYRVYFLLAQSIAAAGSGSQPARDTVVVTSFKLSTRYAVVYIACSFAALDLSDFG